MNLPPDKRLRAPSGYQSDDEYFAQQYQQGGRVIYSLDLSLPQVTQTVRRPDPNEVLEGNRKIQESRAERFAEYLQAQVSSYVCPPLLLRMPKGELTFRDLSEIVDGDAGGTRFGVLSVPRNARQSLEIIDGQHRALGFHIYWEGLDKRLRTAREHLAGAEREGDRQATGLWKGEVDKLLEERRQVSGDRVRLDIVVIDDPVDHKQVFVDIADNAKGVTGSVRARFDNRKVVNRALVGVLKHPLLDGRVEQEANSATGKNPNWLSAKAVADVIRAVQVGVVGRISQRQEDELSDREVATAAFRFFDLLLDAFPVLVDLGNGKLSAAQLRTSSLLGSGSIIRVLAGAYHLLTGIGHPKQPVTAPLTKAEFRKRLASLGPYMVAPLAPKSEWLQSECFAEGAFAPFARQGDLNKLARFVADWLRTGEPPEPSDPAAAA